MSEGARLFGLSGSEALAIYMACVTVLAMMADENVKHEGADALEDAVVHWHRFCTARGLELPSPGKAIAELKTTAKVKVL